MRDFVHIVMNVWTSYTVGYFWTGWALASFYEGLRRDEAFTTVSFHPSVYKTDIPSSAFVPFHWTVPSYRLPWSRSVAVLFINDRQSSIQSKPFHTLHNSFFFLQKSFYGPNLHSIHFPEIRTILNAKFWLLIAEARVRSQGDAGEVYGGQSDTGRRFNFMFSFVSYNSTSVAH